MNAELILQHLLFCSAVMTAVSLGYLFAAKKLLPMQSAHWRFLPWWFLGIGFLTPYKPHFGNPVIAAAHPASAGMHLTADSASEYRALLLLGIWLIGFAVSLFLLIRGEVSMKRSIRRLGSPLTDPQFTALNLVCAELEIDKPVIAVRLPVLQSPMLTGLFQPVILLPADQDYTLSELTLIFRHELTHYRRADLWCRLIWLLVRCFHWFNPAVRSIIRFVDGECELACDEDAMRGQSAEQRNAYCELIVQTAARRRNGFRTGLATNFSCSGAALHRRIMNILGAKRGRRFGLAVVLMLVLTVLTGKLFGVRNDRVHAEREPDTTEISEEITTYFEGGTTVTTSAVPLDPALITTSFAPELINGTTFTAP